MGIIIFNAVGIGMLAASFGIAFLLGKMFGISGEGPLMIIAGPLSAVFDLVYRLTIGKKNWLSSGSGGMLFFLPVWALGVFWLVLGIIYVVTAGHAPG